MQRFITDELMITLGQSPRGWTRPLVDLIMRVPTGRFARMAAEFDDRVAGAGLVSAARWFLSHYIDSVDVSGAHSLPAEGPLLIAANHPGAYDGVAIVANACRDDMQIVISGVPFTRALPSTARHLIYVALDGHDSLAAVRSMIRHLRAGGALLIFPSGLVDPDPDVEPGSEQVLETWSPSLDFLLRQVPETRVAATVVSGVLAKECLHHPLTRLPKPAWEKRKAAEFLQLSQQLAFARKFALRPRISFGEPVTASDLRNGDQQQSLLPALIARERAILAAHETAR